VSVVLAPAPASGTVQRRAIDDFKPLRIRSLLASRWLSFNVMVLLVSLALSVWHLTLLRDDGSNFNAVVASSDRIAVAALIDVIIYLIGAVIFLFWFRRAYANVDSLGGLKRHGTGWAVGSWFVPILNLFRPKQIANDIWRGSSQPEDDRVPLFVHLWWVFWLISTFGENAYGRTTAGTIEEERLLTVLLVVTEVAEILAGVLAILFVSRVTRRQEQRAEQIRERAVQPPELAA
jgi:hypothetical protein